MSCNLQFHLYLCSAQCCLSFCSVVCVTVYKSKAALEMGLESISMVNKVKLNYFIPFLSPSSLCFPLHPLSLFTAF